MTTRILALVLLSALPAMAARPPFGTHWTDAERNQARKVRLTSHLTGAELERIKVGNQAGILKVYGPNREVKFTKGSATSDVFAIDGEKWAPITPTDRESVMTALGVLPSELEKLDRNLMAGYARLPHLQAVALLGLLASGNQSPKVARATITFLEHRILSKEPAQIRRQAVLALAVNPRLEGDEVEVVLKFMKSDSNGWDTFTTGQFFAYHRQQLQASPNFERIKAAVTATDNPHAEDILRDLESKDSP